MPEMPPAPTEVAAAQATCPAQRQPWAGVDGRTVRVLVQNTFIEVVAEDHGGARVRRARSAPAAPAPSTVECGQGAQCGAAEARPDALGAALGPSCQAAATFGNLLSDAEVPGNRTTVLLRNLPPNYTRDLLLELLDAHGFSGLYDFVYVPFEFGSGTTFGFAFVNLIGSGICARFMDVFEGFSSWQVHCQSKMAVSWSFTQGYEAHVDRFRNSPIMDEGLPDGCKPAVFASGARVEFPPPTKRLPLMRRQRRRPPPGARGGAPARPPPLGGLAHESLLAPGLVAAAEAAPPPAARPRQVGRGGAAPSWADLSEDPAGPEGLLAEGLCPVRERRARPPARRPAPRAAAPEARKGARAPEEQGGSSTDAPDVCACSEASGHEPSSSQQSSASGSERPGAARRGRRAGRGSARKSSTSALLAGLFLVPGLVEVRSVVDESGDGEPLASVGGRHRAP